MPEAGLALAGFRVARISQPTTRMKAMAAESYLDESASLGLVILDKTVWDVVPDSPADRAGMAPDMDITAVNGHPFSTTALDQALAASPTTGTVVLTCFFGEDRREYTLAYRGGIRYLVLERDPSRQPLLDRITTPLRPEVGWPRPPSTTPAHLGASTGQKPK